jgi:hypothetical protein
VTRDCPRGARVRVRFPDHGPEHLPFEWTGRVVGPSRIPGRVRVRPEYVTWKGPIHLRPEGEDGPGGYTVTRIAKDAPVEYHEHRPNGLHVVRPVGGPLFEHEGGAWPEDQTTVAP